MQKRVLVIVFAVAAMLLLASVFALLTSTKTIHSTGRIKSLNVEVYSDIDCSQVLSGIAYPDLDSTSSNVTTVYLKNNGNQKMILSMATGNWTPSGIESYISLAWNQEGTILNAGANVTASLTLTVTNAAAGTEFGFDIAFTGTEQT